MRMNFKLLLAFGVGFIATAGATLAQSYGRGRNVAFVDGTAISPSSVTTSGAITGDTLTATTTSADAVYLNSGRPICMNAPTCNAASRIFYNGSAIQAGGGLVATTVNSTVASGSPAYICSNVGCRLSLGNTGRYLYDTGSTLASIGGLSADTFTATTATGSALTGGGASGTLLITSNTPDSVTGVNGPATITMQASQALTSGDQVFRVLTSTGTQAFAVRTNGSLVAGESTGQGVVNFRQWNSQQSAPTEWINDAALTEKNPMRLTHVKDVTADDASLLSIYKNLTTRVMTVSKDGLVRVNASNAAKPTCNADNRGRVYYLDGAAGVADTYEICMKDASDVYAWKTIVTP